MTRCKIGSTTQTIRQQTEQSKKEKPAASNYKAAQKKTTDNLKTTDLAPCIMEKRVSVKLALNPFSRQTKTDYYIPVKTV